jgi:hypothetical protein
MCNHVIVTLLPCFLLLFTSEQIDFLRYFFLFFLRIDIYKAYVQKEYGLILLQSMNGQNQHCRVMFVLMYDFLSILFFFFFYDNNDRRHLGHSFVLCRRLFVCLTIDWAK